MIGIYIITVFVVPMIHLINLLCNLLCIESVDHVSQYYACGE